MRDDLIDFDTELARRYGIEAASVHEFVRRYTCGPHGQHSIPNEVLAATFSFLTPGDLQAATETLIDRKLLIRELDGYRLPNPTEDS